MFSSVLFFFVSESKSVFGGTGGARGEHSNLVFSLSDMKKLYRHRGRA
jgi:hypothetical protein